MTRNNNLDKSWLLGNFGNRLFYYENIDSTMTEAKRILRKDQLSEGTILLSKKQTGGKGRRGREWVSEKGGIWVSYITVPNITRDAYPLYSLMSAVCINKCLKEFSVMSDIKWPNDIFYKNKKMAGIAIDLITLKKDYLIIGIGLNVYNETIDIATSVSQQNSEVDINKLFEKLIYYIDEYKNILHQDRNKILDLWRQNNNILGKEVKVIPASGEKPYYAKALDINPLGALIIKKDKEVKEVVAADVSLRLV